MLRKSLQQMATSKIRQMALREKFSAKIFFKPSFLRQIAAARVHTIKYQSKIFPKDSKTALRTEIGPLGTEL